MSILSGEEKEIELKPCPNCGDRFLLVRNNENGVKLVCGACGMETHYNATISDSAKQWNARFKLDIRD